MAGVGGFGSSGSRMINGSSDRSAVPLSSKSGASRRTAANSLQVTATLLSSVSMLVA